MNNNNNNNCKFNNISNNKPLNIAVLVSGSGSNLQSIIDAIKLKNLNCKIIAVISDRPDVFALNRAKKNNISTYVFDRRKLTRIQLSDLIFETIVDNVHLIVLAGFLSILEGKILEEYKNKIINIHPSLIPAFCGKGMYGMKVHKSVIDYGCQYTGCTVHYVDNGIDTGKIILQKIVKVTPFDTPDSLSKKVLKEEHIAIVEAIKLLIESEKLV